jgi:hypothetical protein
MLPPPARDVVPAASTKCGVERLWSERDYPPLLLADRTYNNLYTKGVTDAGQTAHLARQLAP